jgi:hypothetical protein
VYTEREWARGLGRRGRERAAAVTWDNVFSTLAARCPFRGGAPHAANRPRITVLNAYGVHPPDNGGRYRPALALPRALAATSTWIS